MNNKQVVNLGQIRTILAELDKARAAVLDSQFEAFHNSAMRAILMMSAAKMADDEEPPFQASRM